MNIISDIEISTIIFILYVITRSAASHHFHGERHTGSSLLLIAAGAIIAVEVSSEIGIIAILAGIAILAVPYREEE